MSDIDREKLAEKLGEMTESERRELRKKLNGNWDEQAAAAEAIRNASDEEIERLAEEAWEDGPPGSP